MSLDLALARGASGLTVGSLFRDQVRRVPQAIAVEDGSIQRSYAALSDRVDRLAQHLLRHGVTRGDRIAVLAENRAEHVELQLASGLIGAILACQNWRQSDPELAHCLALAAPRLLFVSERMAQRLESVGWSEAECITFGEEYERALRDAPPGAPPDLAEPEDGLVILYTSGTTGLPKAAVISHRAEIARGVIMRTDGVFHPDRAYLAWTPLFHMAGTDSMIAALTHGAKVILLDGFDPAAIAEIAAREALGWLALMPGTFARMIAEIRSRPGWRAHGVALVGSMADLVPRQEIAEITTLLDAPFRNSFGATETGAAPASRGRIPVGVVPQNLGKEQSSYTRIRLVNEEDREVPDGEPGEVTVRGPGLFSGYWRDPAASSEAFRGGWYHMGDVMRRNPDGTLDFIDRRKYLIKSGGENIYPADIEGVLLASPRIAEAVVVRQPDARWGEVPVAFVVPRDASLTEAEVIGLCRGRIANYKLPRAVRFVQDADLPRSTSGKIRRHTLEQLLAGKDSP